MRTLARRAPPSKISTALASSYHETVLDAFLEVEDTIVTMRHLADQAQNQLEAATAAERTQQLALVRHRAGAADYLEVVTAQTAALYDAAPVP